MLTVTNSGTAKIGDTDGCLSECRQIRHKGTEGHQTLQRALGLYASRFHTKLHSID